VRPRAPYTGPDTDAQLTALHYRERITERQVYTGPATGAQLIALRHLERIAEEQAIPPAAMASGVPASGTMPGAAMPGAAMARGATTIPTAAGLTVPPQRPAPATPTFRPGAAWAPGAVPLPGWVAPTTAMPAVRRDSTLVRCVKDFVAPWPLCAVLAVQAVLSLRLVWANTAFLDEATYVWAGRIELWHLTTGTPVPDYATYFSGAPVLYPPLAGLADILGGLIAARLLSLAFMLGVTCMLWGTTRSLFGRRAALFATALYVCLGSTQFLGSLATFDAMALFLLAVSARLVVAARDRDDSSLLLLAAALALTAANATKYATGLFDPVIIAMAVSLSPRGRKAGLGRGGMMATIVIGLISGLLVAGGPLYLAGLEFSTLSRAAGIDAPAIILNDSARWVGVVVAIACAAAVIAWWRDRPRAWLITVLAVAGVLVPLNQARIHTTTSLLKHVDFGAWFACVAAGYLLALVFRAGRRQWLSAGLAAGVAAAILVPGGAAGRAQAAGFDHSWVNTAQFTAELGRLAGAHRGVYLTEDYEVPGYYLDRAVPWKDWQATWSFGYRAPGARTCVSGSTSRLTEREVLARPVGKAFAQAIAHRYFALIILNFTDTVGADHAIEDDIAKYRTYGVIADIPFPDHASKFMIWARTGGNGGPHGAVC
jgi:hypothetical protein